MEVRGSNKGVQIVSTHLEIASFLKRKKIIQDVFVERSPGALELLEMSAGRLNCAKLGVFSQSWSFIKRVMSNSDRSDFWIFQAQPDDLLVKRRSVVDRNHLVDEVARVEHRDPHQPLDDELRLEQILAFLRQALQSKHNSGSHGSFLVVNSLVPLRGC